jgi:hypothetical protein
MKSGAKKKRRQNPGSSVKRCLSSKIHYSFQQQRTSVFQEINRSLTGSKDAQGFFNIPSRALYRPGKLFS